MEITPEIRQQVMEAECVRLGHEINPYSAFHTDGLGGRPAGPTSPDELKMPFIECMRCGYCWIVLPEGGANYDDAERVLYNLMDKTSRRAQRLLRERTQRQERDRPRKTPRQEAEERERRRQQGNPQGAGQDK